MNSVDKPVKRSSQKVYRGRPLERSYRLFPKKTLKLDEIKYDPSLDDNVDGVYMNRINRQLYLYEVNGFFEDEILVSINKNASEEEYILEAGYPVLKAMSILGIKETEVRVKIMLGREKAITLTKKRLEKQEKAVAKFKELDEKMEKLRQIIRRCDSDMYDLMQSVDEDLQQQIKEAHYISLNTPHIYKKSLKVAVDKNE
ncbi:hypothetical protein [Priestia megaterium]|jgi:formyltetrahydrofolate synthetase|uniref:hypothetical protein n=1 Tax=Priestia megaterium TaxID=1404 RepID=UPI0018666249|nr:hypothetical protein [Priestia megaterium]MBE2977743.1 hypothetical protein [Priestia megaterium]